jgi:hypothetical protein
MNWTVTWLPDALWLSAVDRSLLALAADQIDMQLGRDPLDAGESRASGRRILIVPPLAATFCVRVDDRLVQVVNIREVRNRLT